MGWIGLEMCVCSVLEENIFDLICRYEYVDFCIIECSMLLDVLSV